MLIKKFYLKGYCMCACVCARSKECHFKLIISRNIHSLLTEATFILRKDNNLYRFHEQLEIWCIKEGDRREKTEMTSSAAFRSVFVNFAFNENDEARREKRSNLQKKSCSKCARASIDFISAFRH